MNKPDYHVVSFSGGKDSTAMLLRMIELGYHIDEVVFCDTTMEFPGMIRHVEKVKKVVEEAGVKFVTLRSEHGFEYYLAEVDAMSYCREKGYDWEGLYDIFHRVSCWCCPLQAYSELRKLRRLFPDLWQKLLEMDACSGKPSPTATAWPTSTSASHWRTPWATPGTTSKTVSFSQT